jgi:hypothetical protein
MTEFTRAELSLLIADEKARAPRRCPRCGYPMRATLETPRPTVVEKGIFLVCDPCGSFAVRFRETVTIEESARERVARAQA